MNKVRIAIEGGAGYTAGELLRILLNHPGVEIVAVNSESHSGQPVASAHRDLAPDTDLIFSPFNPDEVDLVFICRGHGNGRRWMESNQIPAGVKVIDLSQDFRDQSDGFVYGLPELQRSAISRAERVANPGCFATAVELALLPLVAGGLLHDDVHITAITGATGAGQTPSQTSHFPWRSNNISVYKPFRHQHLAEINMTLQLINPDFNRSVYMVPVRGDFSRGICAILQTSGIMPADEVLPLFSNYYSSHPFAWVTSANPDLKLVVGTNRCALYAEEHDGRLMIVSMIDNLLKGASGQAVQDMNLMFGFPEDTGLKLHSIAF